VTKSVLYSVLLSQILRKIWSALKTCLVFSLLIASFC
jgi:hypothetical protein